MTETYFPFDSGAGSVVAESQWSKMAQLWKNNGVIWGALNNLEPYGDSTGMQVKIKSGQAWIKGHFYENDSLVSLPIQSAHATLNRYDLIVLRLSWANKTIGLNIVTGTAAATPTIPTPSTLELALGYVYVPAASMTIAANNVTDTRPYANGDDGNFSLAVVIGNNIDVISTGVVCYVEIPVDCVLTGWTIVSNLTGSIVVDIWKDSYANFPPVAGDTIVSGVKPTLSSAQKAKNVSLAKTITAGDWLAFNVDSASAVKQVTLSLLFTKKR